LPLIIYGKASLKPFFTYRNFPTYYQLFWKWEKIY
jgi:hypothetical protein